jgi:transcriptional regulator of arginine metabolism
MALLSIFVCADAKHSRRLSSPATAMSKKSERQNAILQLISAHEIANQEELRQLLDSAGWAVTQATLSRDLHELGVVRAPTDDGARYLLPGMVADESKPSLDTLLPELFSRVDGVGELVVLHTLPSGAQPIAEAIDSQAWPEIIGTLAGENTVLIVCRSAEARATLTSRLIRLSSRNR